MKFKFEVTLDTRDKEEAEELWLRMYMGAAELRDKLNRAREMQMISYPEIDWDRNGKVEIEMGKIEEEEDDIDIIIDKPKGWEF